MRIQTNTAVAADTCIDLLARRGRAGVKSSIDLFLHLTSSLYSNNWWAILRELSANCADIHSRVGQTRPWEIQGPTETDPMLVFTDYGSGLSDNFILGLNDDGTPADDGLFIMGSSSKLDIPTEIGGFGAGFKSVFSKADQVIVESRYFGTRTTFAAYKDKDPDTQGVAIFVDVVEKILTDEPAGLTIRIPVAADDIPEVNKLIAKHLWRFDPQPISNVKLRQVTHLIKTPLFSLRPAERSNGYTYGRSENNVAYAIMGGIAYPIDPDSLGLGYSDPIKKVLNSPLDIHFELGEVCPTMNRERLNYQPRTIEGVKAKVKQVLLDLKAHVELQVAGQPNLWSARQFWNKELTSEIRELLQSAPPTYQTYSLSDSFTVNHDTPIFINLSDKALKLQRPGLQRTYRVHAYVNTTFLRWDPASTISPSSLQRRLVSWGLQHQKHVVIIEADAATTSTILETKFGGAPLTAQIDDDTMPDLGLVRNSSHTPAQRQPLAKFHRVDRYGNRQEIELDPTISHVYCITKSWKPIDPLDAKNIAAESLATLVKTHFEKELILIPATFKKPPSPNWVNAFDILRALANQTLLDPLFLAALQNNEDLSEFAGTQALSLIKQFRSTATVPTKPRSPIGRLYARHAKLTAHPAYPKQADLQNLIRLFNLTPPTLTADPTLDPQIKEIEEAYPLIRLIGEYRWNAPANTAAHWVQYANAI